MNRSFIIFPLGRRSVESDIIVVASAIARHFSHELCAASFRPRFVDESCGRAPSFLSRSPTHPSPRVGERDQYFRGNARWRVTRRRKEGNRGERKRERGKRNEKGRKEKKIKAGSHERLTRRAYTKGREMYRRVERKGTKKKRERKKGGRGGKKKKERGNTTTVSGSGLREREWCEDGGVRLLAVRFSKWVHPIEWIIALKMYTK